MSQVWGLYTGARRTLREWGQFGRFGGGSLAKPQLMPLLKGLCLDLNRQSAVDLVELLQASVQMLPGAGAQSVAGKEALQRLSSDVFLSSATSGRQLCKLLGSLSGNLKTNVN